MFLFHLLSLREQVNLNMMTTMNSFPLSAFKILLDHYQHIRLIPTKHFFQD